MFDRPRLDTARWETISDSGTAYPIRCRTASSPSNGPSGALSIRPSRSTYTSSGPLTTSSVMRGSFGRPPLNDTRSTNPGLRSVDARLDPTAGRKALSRSTESVTASRSRMSRRPLVEWTAPAFTRATSSRRKGRPQLESQCVLVIYGPAEVVTESVSVAESLEASGSGIGEDVMLAVLASEVPG